REERVLGEREVGDDRLGEEVGLAQALQLLHALEQEKELRGQRVAPHVAVELREEGIGLRVLEDHLGAEPLGEALGEAGLAAADGAFDDDVAVLHRKSRAGPFPGITASGHTSRSGSITNRRSWARGCGTFNPASSMTRSP